MNRACGQGVSKNQTIFVELRGSAEHSLRGPLDYSTLQGFLLPSQLCVISPDHKLCFSIR